MRLFLVSFVFQLCHLFNPFQEKQIDAATITALNSRSGATRENELLTEDPLLVPKCKDFTIDGKGTNIEWDKAGWTELAKLDSGGKAYESRFKILYSSTGIYVLFKGMD